MTKKRPGMMLYFRWRNALKLLSHEQQGKLFSAILAYGETGEAPRFDDRYLVFAWSIIQPEIDEDRCRYEARVQSGRAAVSKRWDKRQNDEASSVNRYL